MVIAAVIEDEMTGSGEKGKKELGLCPWVCFPLCQAGGESLSCHLQEEGVGLVLEIKEEVV